MNSAPRTTRGRSRTRIIAVSAAATAGTLLVAACGSSGKTTSASAKNDTTTTAMAQQMAAGQPTQTGAASLRATLTDLLDTHVYLAGITVDTALSAGLTSPATKAASDTLDANTVAISDAIKSVYGADAGAKFLTLWRQHIGFFVDYTKAKASNDQAGVAKAQSDLAGYNEGVSTLLSSANPNLPKDAVKQTFTDHIATLEAAIDALVAKDPAAFAKLQTAASHMPMVADTLAGAIAKQFPDKISGSSTAPASALRATLTDLLDTHVYLAGITVDTALSAGLTSPATKAASDTLDANSVAISEAIKSVYGADAAKQWLSLWRAHIGFFVDYTKAKASNDQAGVAKAQSDLAGYNEGVSQLLSSANPNLPKDAVKQSFSEHIATLEAAIDALVAKDPSAFAKLQTAATHMPMVADTLSGAIVKQFPDKFAA